MIPSPNQKPRITKTFLLGIMASPDISLQAEPIKDGISGGTGRLNVSKRKTKLCERQTSWERVRSNFENPSQPTSVWERQFDYSNDELRSLASTPDDEIISSDLWYYFHEHRSPIA